MNGPHLSEINLQDYALGIGGDNPGIRQHLETCQVCKSRAANYRLTFSGIHLQEQALPDMDLQAMVLSKINPSPAKSSQDNIYGYMLAFFLVFGGIPLYLLRGYFVTFLTGISITVLFSIIAGTSLVLIFRITAMYKDYQEKIKGLNYY